jgi:hypothetical protein
MRSLTFDEMDAVSGGVNPGDETIVVTGFRPQSFYGGASLTSGTFGGVSGFASFGGIDLESLSAVGAAITQWLIDLGLLNDPDEIVVTGERPTPINVGNGTAIAFYPDGINQLFINGQFIGNIRMTDGSIESNTTNTGEVGITPSISDTANFSSHINYEFTREP